MTIGNLFRRSDPTREMGNIVCVWNKGETRGARPLKAQQQRAGLRDGKSVGRSLSEHAHKSQLRN